MIAGVDEAGRGPLAGRVFAAAVVLDVTRPIEGLNDSKKLSAKKRETLAEIIKTHALAWHISAASVEEIDSLNILQATLLAMRRAVDGLGVLPSEILVDGNRLPEHLPVPARAIVGGDASVAEISAASILAKTARDAEMLTLSEYYPEYGFAQHKAYGTKAHLAAIERFGVIQGVHRASFAPVRVALARGHVFQV